MKLERILQAAVNSLAQGKRKPHCFSAFVQGQGYINQGDVVETRPDYIKQAVRAAQSEVDNLGFAPTYAEPGYDNPAKAVLFANWNDLPRDLDRILEHAGYAIEWSDEWSTCDACNGAVRTSPDGWNWTPYYKFDGDCTILCLDCYADENPSDSEEDNTQ